MSSNRPIPLLLGCALLLLPLTACGDSPLVQGPDTDDDGDGKAYSHGRVVGSSAEDLLTDGTYTDLVIEVDYMAGFAPNEEALGQLETFLSDRLNKSSVRILTPTEVAAGGQASYTLSEIRSLEEQHRDEFTEGATLAAYILIVDGRYEQANVLGIAHLNTSTAYFGAAFDAVSGGLTQPSRRLTEATVFRHEFGHLLGLVAIEGSGTEMQTEHQDEPNGHHCDDDTCLMYYAVESTDLFGSVLEGEIPSLDANCLADLRAAGGR